MDRGLVKTPLRKSRDLEFLAKKSRFAKFPQGGFLVIQTINSGHYDNINVDVFKSSKVKRGVNFGDIRKMRGPFAPQDPTLVSFWCMYTSYEMLSWILHLVITTRSSQVEPFLVQPLPTHFAKKTKSCWEHHFMDAPAVMNNDNPGYPPQAPKTLDAVGSSPNLTNICTLLIQKGAPRPWFRPFLPEIGQLATFSTDTHI